MFKRIKEMISYFLFQLGRNKENIDDTSSPMVSEIPYSSNSHLQSVKTKVVVENPLKPFWKYDGEELDPNSYIYRAITRLKDEGRPLNFSEYKDIFDKHICLPNFVSEEKGPYLKKIWKDAQHLNNILQPLTKLGIKYTLDLTGGSVRDFVLNKHEQIKDLDFMLSIEKIGHKANNLLDKGIFTKEQLESVEWNENSYDEESIKFKLLQLCLQLSKDKFTTFSHVESRKTLLYTDSYKGDIFKKDRLLAVVKVDSSETNYPLDILLTDFIKPDFVDGFDFDICKASICFINHHVKKEFPKDYSHLISRFVAEIDFWADVHNNTLTYDTSDRKESQINSSLNNHLPRLMKKFPNSKVLFTGEGEFSEYAKKKLAKDQLTAELEKVNNNEMKTEKKLKI